MTDPDAGQAIEAEKPHTLDDGLAVDNFVIRTNQDWLRIAEPGDGIGDLPDMRGIALTQTTLAQRRSLLNPEAGSHARKSLESRAFRQG